MGVAVGGTLRVPLSVKVRVMVGKRDTVAEGVEEGVREGVRVGGTLGVSLAVSVSGNDCVGD